MQELGPDVLVAGVRMPGPSGIDLAKALHGQVCSSRGLVVTVYEDGALVDEAREAGAAGYHTKRTPVAESRFRL